MGSNLGDAFLAMGEKIQRAAQATIETEATRFSDAPPKPGAHVDVLYFGDWKSAVARGWTNDVRGKSVYVVDFPDRRAFLGDTYWRPRYVAADALKPEPAEAPKCAPGCNPANPCDVKDASGFVMPTFGEGYYCASRTHLDREAKIARATHTVGYPTKPTPPVVGPITPRYEGVMAGGPQRGAWRR